MTKNDYNYATLSGCDTRGCNIYNNSSSSSPASSPAWCRDKCGDLTIPFPFGIELQVMTFTSRDCYDTKGLRAYRNTPILWLSPSYTISNTKNKFVAIGCDTYALFQGYRGEERFITGCMSLCDSLGSVEYQDSYCSGIGCCQTSIPSGLKNCTVQLSSYYNHTFIMDFNPCSYAFIVEQGQFKFNSTSFQQLNSISQIPMVINWEIGDETCDIAAQKREDFVCKADYSECVNRNTTINGSGYICQCLPGYQGNPYLPHGCQGVSGGFLVLLVGISLIYWQMQRRKFTKLKEQYFIQNGGLLLQEKLASQVGSVETTKIFTAEELEKATNNYHESRILGEGGYGIVYKGILPDSNRVVAIKKSKIGVPTQKEQFVNELIVLSQINHRNVVRLFGCCLETSVPLLVYEFIANGTLFEHIHHINGRGSSFSWELRLKIAAETAGALAYLHSSALMQIIHRDVKATNILLDDNYMAKVSDFGASRLIPLDQNQLTTLVQGTFGYLDPEYFLTNQLTEKSDVYSFGVVLMELLTSKVALSFARPEEERNLASFFVCSMDEGHLYQILDDDIANERNIGTLQNVADLAKRCVRFKGEDRPSMKEVAMELEGMRIAAKHPWGKDDICAEETEYFLGSPNSDTYLLNVRADCGPSGTSSGYDSMQNQLLVVNPTAATAQARPNCQDKCGNLTIPYPFGMGEGCYLRPEFNITCNQSAQPPSAHWMGGTNRITNFSVADGELQIMLDVATACYDDSGEETEDSSSTWLELPPPYSMSHTQNNFTTVGCDTLGIFVGERSGDGGPKKEKVKAGNSVTLCGDILGDALPDSCSGFGCSQASIPGGLRNISTFLQSLTTGNRTGIYNPWYAKYPCSYAFIVEQGNFSFNPNTTFQELNNSRQLPAVLNWAVEGESCDAAQQNPNFPCKENTKCVERTTIGGPPAYICQCSSGYLGNPYLPDSCQDIDECKDSNPCSIGTCINFSGDYSCKCPKGYKNDDKNQKSCIEHNPSNRWKIILLAVISLGVSAGLLVLLIGISWIYWGLHRRKIMKLKEKYFKENGGLLLQQQLAIQGSPMETTKIFTAEELEKATNNYHESRVLGEGGYGTVYKGVLPDNKVVAIKKSKIGVSTQKEQFVNEMIVLSQINHINVVRLLGCCLETPVPLLVYEFITNGTLFEHIHNTKGKGSPLSCNYD
ncbi:cell wall-associated kinase [Prunus dulcis]|uniref:Cell wall-associated kinase n=1 Tax=Prunus dulcis TaxID=3755 RepID=A0A4Y1RAG5_PRUDU|nr:cell wall-associated kinase [Prunus dulcis]